MKVITFLRLWSAMLLMFFAFGIVFPVLPLYMAYRGLTDLEIGVVTSISTLVSLIPAILLGTYSDIVANRELLESVIGFCIAILLPLYLQVTSFHSFIIVHSIYTSLIFPYVTLSTATTMDYITEGRGGFFGKFRTSGAVGWIFGTMLGGYLVDVSGYSILFMITPVFFMASAILYAYGGIRRNIRKFTGRLKTKRFSLANDLVNNKIYPLLASIFVASLSNPAYYTFLPLFMTQELRTPHLWLL